jgi:hypothetical protein
MESCQESAREKIKGKGGEKRRERRMESDNEEKDSVRLLVLPVRKS